MRIVLDSAVWFHLDRCGIALKVASMGRELCTLDAVLAEMHERPTEAELRATGVAVEPVTSEQMELSIAYRERSWEVSVTDAYCLAVAKTEGMTLATRDGPLEDLAAAEGVNLCRVEHVVLTMAEAGLLTETEVATFRKYAHDHLRPLDRSATKRAQKAAKGIE